MKKTISIILMLVIGFILTGCENPDDTPYVVDCDKYPTHESCEDTTEPPTCNEGYVLENDQCVLIEEPGDFLEIYYINDFHGALEQDDDQLGIAYIANYIKTRKEMYPENVLFIAGGDILQGSALSNYYYGLSTINLLNLIGLDAFTLGNHEFDWGIETVLAYADGNTENGEANFPFLGANVFFKHTTNIPEEIEPYTIIQKGNYKVGIIGTMGYGLESSIAYSRISDYEFGSPITAVKYYAEYLRTVEECDIIIVSAHDSGSVLNNALLELTGDYKVDAIFNGHSHTEYALINSDTPILQAGDNGEFLGYVRFDFTETTTSVSAENLRYFSSSLLRTPDTEVQNLLDQYILELEDIIGQEIFVSDEYYSSAELSVWLASLMRISTNPK